MRTVKVRGRTTGATGAVATARKTSPVQNHPTPRQAVYAAACHPASPPWTRGREHGVAFDPDQSDVNMLAVTVVVGGRDGDVTFALP